MFGRIPVYGQRKHTFRIETHGSRYNFIKKRWVREPHWHPNATELNFVLKEKARLTIFSPGGLKDTFDLEQNQGSVIPAGYFHHIENMGS